MMIIQLLVSFMHKTVYKHIDAREFYILFNVIRLHFISDYDISKYGTKSKRFKEAYDSDKLQVVYQKLAQKIESPKRAVLLIVSNFIANEKCFITQFSLEPKYYTEFLRYSANKQAVIQDFSDLCKSSDIFGMVEDGTLSEEIHIKKENIVLMSYINKILPIVNLANDNNTVSPIMLDLFYGQKPTKKKKSKKSRNLFERVALFAHVNAEDKAHMLPIISEIFIK